MAPGKASGGPKVNIAEPRRYKTSFKTNSGDSGAPSTETAMRLKRSDGLNCDLRFTGQIFGPQLIRRQAELQEQRKGNGVLVRQREKYRSNERTTITLLLSFVLG